MHNGCTRSIRLILSIWLSLGICTPLFANQTPIKEAQELLAQGSVDEAIASLRRTIAADPQNADAHLLLGSVLALQGVRGESLEQLQEAVRLRPYSAVAHNRLGSALSRFVEMDAARQEFEKAISLDPRLAEAHIDLSLVLAQQGDLDAAGAHLDRAIAIEGNSLQAANAHYLRSRIWAAKDQVENTRRELESALKLRPDYAEAWSDLGFVRRAHDPKGAETALERSIAIDPKSALAQYRLGQVYLENGKTTDAITHLKIALSYTPDDRATLYSLARALGKAGRIAEADAVNKQITEQLEARHHASDVGWQASELNSEGIELQEAGDVKSALVKYKAAVDLDPTGFGFRLNYALALCRVGQWQDAVAELHEVLRVDPNNADAQKALYIATDQVVKVQQSQ
jgi:tetratricopeptide (TPR) repeat protein